MLAIYTRLSIEDDASDSIETQILEGKEYAQKNNYSENDYIIYNEGEGVKGHSSIEKRPQLSRLVEDIKQGKIKLIYVRKQSRISRKLSVIDKFLTILNEHNINVYFGDKGLLDMSLPTTKFMLQMFGAMDELAPNQQSYETKKSQRLKAERGEVWGVLPYGYRKCEITKKAIIDDFDGGIIKRIFKLSSNNVGTTIIARTLNEEGVETKMKKLVTNKYNDKEYKQHKKYYNKTKKKIVEVDRTKSIWLPKTIYDILKNRWYIGERKYSDEVYPVPAIIDKELFQQVQTNLKNNTSRNGKGVQYRFLLKGVLICGKCGRAYNGNRKYNKKKHNPTSKYIGNYYQCATKRSIKHKCDNFGISIPAIEGFIIKHLFKSKDLLEHIRELEVNDNALQEQKNILEQYQAEHKKHLKSRGSIENLIDSGELINPQRQIKRLNNIEETILGLETKIERTKIRIEEVAGDRLKRIEEELDKFNDNYTFAQYKEAVHNIVDEIKVLGQKNESINDNKKYFIIQVKYKSYDEYSTFLTRNPYTKWLWLSKVYTTPTKEDIQEDIQRQIDLVEYETGKKIKLTEKDHHKIRQDFYVDRTQETIYLDSNEFVDFD